MVQEPGRGAEATFAPGTKLKQYELLRLLGVGGMAEVHLARTRRMAGFERLVVIKRILPSLASSSAFCRMFLSEARIAASLRHANIVQVHDVDEVDGALFYAMEFLHGHDVRQIAQALRAKGRVLPLDQAISIILGVCAGLHHAHETCGPDGTPLNLVHRDVTPHNIVVTFDGSVKIIDFGIAKLGGTPGTTRVGEIKGKSSYMSPEQCLALPLDRRSDIFAIAIVLYEITSGHRLFGGKGIGDYEALKSIVESDVPPPSKSNPGYPRDLEAIVLKGLKRDRAARYQTARELQHDLEAFAKSHDLDASPLALARFMEDLFQDELLAWRSSQQAGVSLADHVNENSRQWDFDVELEMDDEIPVEVSLMPSPRSTGTLDAKRTVVEVRRGSRRRAFAAVVSIAIAAGLGLVAWWSLAARRSAAQDEHTAAMGVSANHAPRDPTAMVTASAAPSVSTGPPPSASHDTRDVRAPTAVPRPRAAPPAAPVGRATAPSAPAVPLADPDSPLPR